MTHAIIIYVRHRQGAHTTGNDARSRNQRGRAGRTSVLLACQPAGGQRLDSNGDKVGGTGVVSIGASSLLASESPVHSTTPLNSSIPVTAPSPHSAIQKEDDGRKSDQPQESESHKRVPLALKLPNCDEGLWNDSPLYAVGSSRLNRIPSRRLTLLSLVDTLRRLPLVDFVENLIHCKGSTFHPVLTNHSVTACRIVAATFLFPP